MTQEKVGTNGTTVDTKPPQATSAESVAQDGPSIWDGLLKGLSKDEAISKAASNLSQGKRSLLIKDVQQALVTLSDACDIYSEILGPFSAPEAHFYYGKALLENARSELSVLPVEAVGKIEEQAEDDDEDSEKEEEEDEEDEDKEKDEEDDKKEEDLNAPSPALETADETKTTVKESEQPGAAVPSTSNGAPSATAATEGEEGEEDQSNLGLAWEVLEIAKISFQKQLEELHTDLTTAQAKDDDESKQKVKTIQDKITELKRRLSDTHLVLGEVAMESEFYEQSQTEFRTSLTILEETEREDCSREVAEVYFQLGLAFHFDKKFDQSIESYQKAIKRIQNRIGVLETIIEKKETVKDLGVKPEDPNYSEEGEIADLKQIVVELEEKVADTVDAKKDTERSQQEDKVEQEILGRNSPVKNPQAPAVNDISHLVKKKKKLDDVDKFEPASKKVCLNKNVVDASTNGNHA